jgi:hypothetical protein
MTVSCHSFCVELGLIRTATVVGKKKIKHNPDAIAEKEKGGRRTPALHDQA